MKAASLRDKIYMVVLTVMYLSCVSAQAIANLYMSCGATITFQSGNEVMLQLTKTRTYWSNADCDTVVRTLTSERLSIKLIEITLADCGDMLTLYDDSFDTVLYSHNCSSPAPVHDVTTSGYRALLKFTSNAIGNNGHFSLLITSFFNASTASCDTEQGFKCNNDRCLGSDLSCNNRDNCGDNSDEANCEDEEYNVWWIVLLSITGVAVVAFLIYGFKLACDQSAKDKAAAKAKKNNETPAPSTSRACHSDSESSQSNTPPQQNSPQAAASAGIRNKSKRNAKRGSVKPQAKPSVSTSTQTDTPPSAPSQEEEVSPTTNTMFQPSVNPLMPVAIPPAALPMGTPVVVHFVPVPQPRIPTSQPSDQTPPSYESVMAGAQPPVITRTDGFLPQNTNSTSPMYPSQGVYVIAVPSTEPSDTQPPTYTPTENNHK